MENSTVKATVNLVVFTYGGDRILKSTQVDGATCLDEAMAQHKKYSRHVIGLFEDRTGRDGAAMFFYPETDDRS